MGMIQEFFAKIGDIIDDALGKITDSVIIKSMIKVGVVFLLVIIIVLMFASCSKPRTYSYEEFLAKMVSITKTKYKDSDKLPKNDKESITVQLQSFVDDETIKPIEEMLTSGATCTGEIKIINNNGYYLYLPTLDCGDKYKTTTIYDKLINETNVVNQGNGLYSIDNAFVYRGESVKNYLSLAGKLFRIIRVNGDGTIRLVDTSKRDTIVWDNRYNVDVRYGDGINTYFVNGINSRIKDNVENYYRNTITNDYKPFFTTQEICVGKRSLSDDIFNTSIECSETIDNFPFGLMYPYEYYLASLDESCKTIKSASCRNYNYISRMANSRTIWTMTGDKDSSYNVFKISNVGASLAKASANNAPLITAQISGDLLFNGGNGTEKDPYTVKTFVETKKKK